jgi:hypothetical protein
MKYVEAVRRAKEAKNAMDEANNLQAALHQYRLAANGEEEYEGLQMLKEGNQVVHNKTSGNASGKGKGNKVVKGADFRPWQHTVRAFRGGGVGAAAGCSGFGLSCGLRGDLARRDVDRRGVGSLHIASLEYTRPTDFFHKMAASRGECAE